jgi:hypothetical protein
MINDDMKRTIEFIVNQQAKNEVEIHQLRVVVNELTGNVDKLTARVSEVAEQVSELAEQAEEDRQVIKEAFTVTNADIGRLVNIVENTRDFTQQVARLAVASEKRITRLEESKQ